MNILTLNEHHDEDGWTLDFNLIREIKEHASKLEDVSMEQAEAVTLALVDLGFAKVKI